MEFGCLHFLLLLSFLFCGLLINLSFGEQYNRPRHGNGSLGLEWISVGSGWDSVGVAAFLEKRGDSRLKDAGQSRAEQNSVSVRLP